jgi:hypothetical protein
VLKPFACLQLILRACEEVVEPAAHMHLQQHCYCRVVSPWKRADTPASRPAPIGQYKCILGHISVTLGKPRTKKLTAPPLERVTCCCPRPARFRLAQGFDVIFAASNAYY